MYKSYLRRFEDPKMPLLAPNYWCLKKMGMILPETKWKKYMLIIAHEIVVIFVITQYMELYMIRSDLDLVVTNMITSMVSIVCAVKANTFMMWQQRWRDVIDYVTEADNFERQNADDERKEIVDKYSNYCHKLTFYYWGFIFVTVITIALQPMVIYHFGSENNAYSTELFPHILSSWMPFDKNHSPGCYITIVWHLILSIYGAGSMAAFDTAVVNIIVFFGGKSDLLRDRCRKITERIQDNDETRYEKTLRELHSIHVKLIKYSKLFNSILSPVMFLYMVNCSLFLCVSAFQITSSNNAGQKLLMFVYLTFGIAQLFLFCWHSNMVLYKSLDMTIGPYESEWWLMSVKQRKALMLLAGQLNISNIFTAGPFTPLTLATFISILKGAYSYYTLLRK